MPRLTKPKPKRIEAITEHASGDKRFKILQTFMKRHQFRADALIEVLHKAQELFGYLEDDLLIFISPKVLKDWVQNSQSLRRVARSRAPRGPS